MDGNIYSTLALVAAMFAAFYFLIIRPGKKRQQAQAQTMNSIVPGTRVMLGSGLFGTVVRMGEKQAVIEISPGVELTVLKPAIARIATEADEEDSWQTDDEDDSEPVTDETEHTSYNEYVADPASEDNQPSDESGNNPQNKE